MSTSVGQNFLEHHGILGMKWGVRKRRDGSVKTSRKEALSEDFKKVAEVKAKQKTTGTGSLSNSELQTAITRMNLERQFSDLSKGQASPGQKFVTGLVANTTKQVVSKQLTKYAGLGLETAIKAAFKK